MLEYFDLVKEKLVFDRPDTIYMVDITYRQTDHPNNWPYRQRQYPVKWIMIRKKEDLDFYKDEIMKICETMGARAYINTSPRCFLNAQEQVKDITSRLLNIYNVNDTYIDVIGQYLGTCPSYDTKWTIDIDILDENYKQSIINHIDSVEGNHNWYWFEVRSHKGYHIYTKPFNTEGFKTNFPLTDIVNNRGIFLYYPQSLEK